MKPIDSIYKVSKYDNLNKYPLLEEITVATNESKSFLIVLNDYKNIDLKINSTLEYKLFFVYQHEIKISSSPFSIPGFYPDALIPLEVAINNNMIKDYDGDNLVILVSIEFKQHDLKPDNFLIINNHDLATISIKYLDITLKSNHIPKTIFGIFEEMFEAQNRKTSKREYIKEINDLLHDYKICSNKLVGDEFNLQLEEIKTKSLNDNISTITIPNYFIKDEFDYDFLSKILDELSKCSMRDNQNYLEKLVIYNTKLDEPYIERYPQVFEHKEKIIAIKKSLTKKHNLNEDLSKALLNIPDIITTFFRDDLYGGVDTWCPTFVAYQMDELIYESKLLKKASDKIWWYGCVWPLHPYPNYHIDDNFTNIRVLNYLQFFHQIEGNLYWGVNLNQKYNFETLKYENFDIWSDTLVFPPANGDGFLMYEPTNINYEFMLPSLRLEQIKLGIIDYQYCMLLEEHNKELSKAYDFSYDFDDYYKGVFSHLHVKMQITSSETTFLKSRKLIQELILLAKEHVFVQINNNKGNIKIYSKEPLELNHKSVTSFDGKKYTHDVFNLVDYVELNISINNNNYQINQYFSKTKQLINVEHTYNLFESNNFLTNKIEKQRIDFSKIFEIEIDVKSYSEVAFAIEAILENQKGQTLYLGYLIVAPYCNANETIKVNLPWVSKYADIESTSFVNNYNDIIKAHAEFDFGSDLKIVLNLKNYKTFQKEEPRYKTCYRYRINDIRIKQ